MESLYRKGELLQVHTKNCEVVEGRFYSMNKDKSKISLYDVKEGLDKETNENICHYYDAEVRSIVKLQGPEDQVYLKISQKQFEDIVKISKKYVYINQVDSSFHSAVEDLNSYGYIAVSNDGSNMGRKCKMPFLVMSTPQQIYIFDIQAMQYHAFDAGLKDILEGESPKKIIHDCRKLSDCLYHKHNIKLNSVFDTQVGDIIVTKNKTGKTPNKVKTLAECLNLYIGLKVDCVEDKLDIVKCTERPLSVEIKSKLAKNISFLHQLSELVNEAMMLPFSRGIEYFVKNLRSCDDFKAWELSGNHLQLPKDFKTAIEY